MLKFAPLAHIAVLGSLIAAPVMADTDPQPGLLDFFSINRIGTLYANLGIAALRTQMELEYDYLSTDLMRGSISISGVTARPQLPYDQARQCVVTVERAVLNTDVAKPFEIASEMNLNLIGAKANSACLPREVAMGLRAAGIRDIELDQFKIRGAYTYTTGETTTDASIAINNFAALDFSASGMILPRLERGRASEPAFRVMRAVVSLKDQGAWNTVSAILPQNFRDPQTISDIGTEAVTQFLSNDGLRSVTAVERNFVGDLMARVEDFVTDPGEITVEASLPATGIVIEPELYDQEPQALIAALALEARSTPLARARILNGSDLAALSDPSGLSAEQLLTLSRALLEGNGVPQTPALVPGLLEDLTQSAENGAEASALVARALQASDPAAAYPYALRAAAWGSDSTVSLLDRLENQMTTTEVLSAQAANPAPLASVSEVIGDAVDPRRLRAMALAHFSGAGQPRSYARAYYFSLLAEAAGDLGASTLKSEIEDRFSVRGDDVAQAWATLSTDLQSQALQDWIAGGLADRFQTQ